MSVEYPEVIVYAGRKACVKSDVWTEAGFSCTGPSKDILFWNRACVEEATFFNLSNLLQGIMAYITPHHNVTAILHLIILSGYIVTQ